mmetsp:Transcript_1841/g.8089  ORF Transcript_1841/g.8089 Transcript_1841/m.8089 type:complete len:238 (+) Transcript_1841:1145-1858(+)
MAARCGLLLDALHLEAVLFILAIVSRTVLVFQLPVLLPLRLVERFPKVAQVSHLPLLVGMRILGLDLRMHPSAEELQRRAALLRRVGHLDLQRVNRGFGGGIGRLRMGVGSLLLRRRPRFADRFSLGRLRARAPWPLPRRWDDILSRISHHGRGANRQIQLGGGPYAPDRLSNTRHSVLECNLFDLRFDGGLLQLVVPARKVVHHSAQACAPCASDGLHQIRHQRLWQTRGSGPRQR